MALIRPTLPIAAPFLRPAGWALALGGVAAATVAQEAPPPTSRAVEATWSALPFSDGLADRPLANFRLRLNARVNGPAALVWGEAAAEHAALPPGEIGLDALFEQRPGSARRVEIRVGESALPVAEQPTGPFPTFAGENLPPLSWAGDFTVAAHFETTEGGTLIARCAPEGKWTPNAKALFLREGRLVYDIGWLGALTGGGKLNDGKPHRVILRVCQGVATLTVDGKSAGQRAEFTRPDNPGEVIKIGQAASDFGHAFRGGALHQVLAWDRALEGAEWEALLRGAWGEVNTPSLAWAPPPAEETFAGHGHPGVPLRLRLEGAVTVHQAEVQALEEADHAHLARPPSPAVLAQGQALYESLCVTCHGTPAHEGSLPTALKFHAGIFRNGSDPYRMVQTLAKGYGQMIPLPHYTPAQAYAVAHYIRETYVRPNNPAQYQPVDEAYLARLPRGLTPLPAATPAEERRPPYERMDFGPALFWTYQVDPGTKVPNANLAQKGLAIRLDEGPGGISRGRAWMVYDLDTLRLAAGWTGRFVDWRGIAFDGSHGTHLSLGEAPVFALPPGPGWANPETGDWTDPRPRSRDGRPYGPLARSWAQYRALHRAGEQVAIEYTVGARTVIETPGQVEYGKALAFNRILHVGPGEVPARMRAAPTDGFVVHVTGDATVAAENGFQVVTFAAGPTARVARVSVLRAADAETLAPLLTRPVTDPATLRLGHAPAEGEVTTRGERGAAGGAFAVDTLTLPRAEDLPSRSWMRLGGFDFDPPRPDRAFVCTWNGEVWRVDGVTGELAELRWRRLASGLFQPLGLKVLGGVVHVACRDQIVRLRDRNGDEVTDTLECFNNDHQVTEHFHEFAMGLQADAQGNLYYAKSARHALPALIPHHGTLLRVSADGGRTDILATGFRAANGVCLNPDGTFFVTDQEGHWTPKNRINRVREGGFYGNMFGFHDVVDSADAAMEPPLCWITNEFDRSPSELLWVPADSAWGPLRGTLLNLSYGYGRVYTVPFEEVGGRAQGGMCALPIPDLPTGIHRGRFHPENGQLYVAGMFAWGSSRLVEGGFHRIRYLGETPALVPVGLQARRDDLTITFSDPLHPDSARAERALVKVWDLLRSAKYGSKHLNERALPVASSTLSTDGRTLVLGLPGLAPTWGMAVELRLLDASGREARRVIHNSVHALP
jgi:mono/diheme cytochrome c family protein